jgi:hypothetical protein
MYLGVECRVAGLHRAGPSASLDKVGFYMFLIVYPLMGMNPGAI